MHPSLILPLALQLGLFLPLVASAAPAAPAGPAELAAPEDYLSPARGHIVISPEGSVMSVDIDTRLGTDIVGPVEAMIATWRFKPLDDGEGAGERRLSMDLLLAAQMWPEEERIRIGVQEARFHAGKRPVYVRNKLPDGTRITPPKYPEIPRGMRGRPPQARMTLLVHRGEDGRVDNVELAQGWHLSHQGTTQAEVARWQRRFLAAVREAAKDWVIRNDDDHRCFFVPVSFSGYDQLWDRAQPMQPASLQGPCAKDFGEQKISTMGDIKPIKPISKLLPEAWAVAAD